MTYGSHVTSNEQTLIRERRAQRLSSRIRAYRDQYNMVWGRRDLLELVARCLRIMDAGEGIDDVDLRTLVRLFNRELIGVQHEKNQEHQSTS